MLTLGDRKLLVRVVLSCPSRADAQAAHKQAAVTGDYDATTGRANITVAGVPSVWRATVVVPSRQAEYRFPGPGEPAYAALAPQSLIFATGV
jgi:hypothetical protein